MKKINFFQTRSFLASCFLLGLMFFASIDMTAQANNPANPTPANVYTFEITHNRIPALQALQSNFSSTSAKWQVVQDAIDYYNNVIADLNNPNPAVVSAIADVDFFANDLIRRADEFTVLYNYSPAQLAVIQNEYTTGVGLGLDVNPTDKFKKVIWILEANAY